MCFDVLRVQLKPKLNVNSRLNPKLNVYLSSINISNCNDGSISDPRVT